MIISFVQDSEEGDEGCMRKPENNDSSDNEGWIYSPNTSGKSVRLSVFIKDE